MKKARILSGILAAVLVLLAAVSACADLKKGSRGDEVKELQQQMIDLGVLEGFRRRRLGDLVLRLLLYKAQSHAAREVRLECPRDVTGFFSRLGLKEESSSGDAVEMMIPGDLIDLDTCKNCPKASCPNRHD